MTSPQLAQFKGQKYLSIESYRKNGQEVRTPVWFVEENGILYVRTSSISGKVKRIKRNSKIRIAVSNGRGTPKSEWYDAAAHVQIGSDNQRIFGMLKTKYGFQWRAVGLLHKITRGKGKQILLAIQIK